MTSSAFARAIARSSTAMRATSVYMAEIVKTDFAIALGDGVLALCRIAAGGII
jgi:hypothetical protein